MAIASASASSPRSDSTAAALSPAQRAAIEQLMVDYVHAIDDGDYERWPTFFTENGRYQVTGRDNHARGWVAGMLLCDNRDMMIDRIYSLRQVNVWEPHTYRHVTGPTRVLATRTENGVLTVDAQTNYLCVRTMHDGEQKLFSSGRYVDQIVFDGAQPMFASRLVLSDSNRIDTLLVIPI